MSVFHSQSSLLTIRSRIWKEGRRVFTRTNLLLQVLALFSYCRSIVIDPTTNTLSIRVRYLWLLTRNRELPFHRLRNLEYRYSSLPTSFSWFRTTDEVESFKVLVALDDGSEEALAAFRGEGARMTGIGGVLLGDDLFDAEGTQQQDSLNFVDEMQELLGIPLGAPLLSSAEVLVCSSCRRVVPGGGACSHCGGRAEGG